MPVSFGVQNKALPIFGQILDTVEAETRRKAELKRQGDLRDERFAREDMQRQEKTAQAGQIRKQNALTALIQNELNRKDTTPERRAALLDQQIQNITSPESVAGGTLADTLAPDDPLVPTPDFIKQMFPKMKQEIPQSKLDRFQKLFELQQEAALGQRKIETEVARTGKEKALAEKARATAAKTRKELEKSKDGAPNLKAIRELRESIKVMRMIYTDENEQRRKGVTQEEWNSYQTALRELAKFASGEDQFNLEPSRDLASSAVQQITGTGDDADLENFVEGFEE